MKGIRLRGQDGATPSIFKDGVLGATTVSGRVVPAGTVLVLATALVVTTADSNNVYLYCTALFACVGALSLGLLMGTAGQVSIGNSAFLAVGAFVGMWASRAGLPLPAALLIATSAAGLAGVLVGLPALRIQGLYLALATLAAHFIVLYFITEYQKSAVGSVGFLITPALSSGGLDQQQKYWAWILTAVVVACLAGVAALQRGKMGRVLGFMKEHEHVAACLGIDSRRYKLVVFVLSSAAIGFQGSLMPYFSGTLSVDTFSLDLAIAYIAMIMIGGTGNIFGPVIGAFVVVIMPTLIPDVLGAFVVNDRAANLAPSLSQIAYGVLIIVMITRSSDGISGMLRYVKPQSWFISSRATKGSN